MSTEPLFVSEPSMAHSARLKDLLRSQVRSHASRVSHQRNRSSQPKPNQHPESFMPGVTCINIGVRPQLCLDGESSRSKRSKSRRLDPQPTKGRSRSGKVHLTDEHEDTGSEKALPTSSITDFEIVSFRSTHAPGPQPVGTPPMSSDLEFTARVGPTERKLLHYFINIWMPSVDHIPDGCHVTGFTPLSPRDPHLSTEIVRGALQSSGELHMYALLTINATRMQYVHQLPLQEVHVRERYYGRALKALRRHLLDNELIDQRLVMDVTFLALSEGCDVSPTRSNVYWQLLIQLIRVCGGLRNLNEFVACLCIATDVLISACTLTVPGLDFSKRPELLGLGRGEVEGERAKEAIAATVIDLGQRLRILCQESMTLARIVKAIHDLGETTYLRAMEYVKNHSSFIYRLLTTPATPYGSRPTDIKCAQQAMTADGLMTHARQLGCSIWLWYIAISFLENRSTLTSCVSEHVSDMCKSLDCAVDMFLDTGWAVKNTLLLWLAALGLLTSTIVEDKDILTTHFVQVLQRADITSEVELCNLLQLHPPLDVVDERWMDKLWPIFQWAD